MLTSSLDSSWIMEVTEQTSKFTMQVQTWHSREMTQVSNGWVFFAKLSEKASRYPSSDLAPCKNHKLPIRSVIHFLVFIFMIYDQIPNQTKCDLSQNVSLKDQARGWGWGVFQIILPSALVLLHSGVLYWFVIAIQSQSCRCTIPWLNIDYLMLCTKLIQSVVGLSA